MRFSFSAPDGEGRLCISSDRCQAVDSLENALRAVFQWFALKNGCLMIHAACAGNEEHCILLPASEGGGKSTVASLCAAQGLVIYGDDLVLAADPGKEDTPPTVYGLPFRGEQTTGPFPARSAELKEVLFLEKGNGCSVRKLNRAEGAARLVSNIPFTRSMPTDMYRTLLVAAERIVQRDAGILVCDLESDPAAAILERLDAPSE